MLMENDPLAPFLKALREFSNNMRPADIGAMDQFRAVSGERARELLAYHILTCLNSEKGDKDEASRYSLKIALKLKALSQADVMGVIITLNEIISEFLLAQGDGTYATAVARLCDPDIPLIPGRSNELQDLEKLFNAEGPSGD